MTDTFDLKIGFKCNNNCKHCVVASKRASGELTLVQIKTIVDDIPPSVDNVTITGGEPSISPIFYDILKYVKEKGFHTTIQTNGTGFSDLELVKKCKPYLDHIHLAIHSSNPEVHDFIVGSPGMWEKTIQGFKNIISQGIFCTTQTVLSNYNIDTLYDTYSFIQKTSPKTEMSMTYPHMMGNAYENREEVCFRYSDHKEMIQRCLKDFGEYLYLESIPMCYIFPYEDRIQSTLEEGIFEYFEEIKNGKPSSKRLGVDFSDGIYNKDYNVLDFESRKKAPRCKDCVFDGICIGVWKEYIDLFKNKLDLYPITKEKYFKGKKEIFS